MEEVDEEKNGRTENGYVHDSSVDYRGRAPLRASTGVWRAAIFILVMEFAERMAYYGVATNLINYLTEVLHEDLQTAAKNVNYWNGAMTLTALVGAFLTDGYVGRFRTVLVSSFIYLVGLGLLVISELVPSLKHCSTNMCSTSTKVHEVVFFLGIYIISVGTGGHKTALQSSGGDQFDDVQSEEVKKKSSYFNWWTITVCSGTIPGITVVVYLQENVSWGLSYIVLTIAMASGVVIFLLGMPFYRYRVLKGSPFAPVLQVLVAAVAKRNLPHPPSPTRLFEVPESQRGGKRLLPHTKTFRFLDKAAILEDSNHGSPQSTAQHNPWRLATVTNVEEMKLLLNIIPIWLSTLIYGLCMVQNATFFIKLGSTMNRKLKHNFLIPPATLYALSICFMMVTVSFYDRVLVPIFRRLTGNVRGMSILQRVGIGMVCNMLSMVSAAVVEWKRLHTAQKEQKDILSMSIFWLVLQFLVIGVGNGFTLAGLQEFFYNEVPDTMRSIGIALYVTVLGTGQFLSSLLITIVEYVTTKGGGNGWLVNNLNQSRLDYYYWLLADLAGLNLCYYIFVATRYSYKKVEKMDSVSDSHDGLNQANT